MYLSENNLLSKVVVTEEDYNNFQALNKKVDYVIKKIKNHYTSQKEKDDYYYVKYSWEDFYQRNRLGY
jgi:E3 ubiquitin-protein ligase DOA10